MSVLEERVRLAEQAHKGPQEMESYLQSVLDDVSSKIKAIPAMDAEERPLALNQVLCDLAYRLKPQSRVDMAVLILAESGILSKGKAELEIAKLRGFIS